MCVKKAEAKEKIVENSRRGDGDGELYEFWFGFERVVPRFLGM